VDPANLAESGSKDYLKRKERVGQQSEAFTGNINGILLKGPSESYAVNFKRLMVLV
jgi:hypothetical protein